MQITLNHEEIFAALETYVRTRIAVADTQKIIIDMRAGRGENGYTATLEIVSDDTVAALPAATSLGSAPRSISSNPGLALHMNDQIQKAMAQESVDDRPKPTPLTNALVNDQVETVTDRLEAEVNAVDQEMNALSALFDKAPPEAESKPATAKSIFSKAV